MCLLKDQTIALLASDQRFINICETFEALGRFKENTIDLSSFDQEAFQRLRQVSLDPKLQTFHKC
jgi:hypothetical protein